MVTHTRIYIKSYCVPLWGTHEIIKVPERGGSIIVKYTKRLFKFANFQMFRVLSKRLVWFYIFVCINYNFKARFSIEFAGGVNKKYYLVRQISRIQYKLTIYCVRWNKKTAFVFATFCTIMRTPHLAGDDRMSVKEGFLPKQAAAKPQIISHQTF